MSSDESLGQIFVGLFAFFVIMEVLLVDILEKISSWISLPLFSVISLGTVVAIYNLVENSQLAYGIVWYVAYFVLAAKANMYSQFFLVSILFFYFIYNS